MPQRRLLLGVSALLLAAAAACAPATGPAPATTSSASAPAGAPDEGARLVDRELEAAWSAAGLAPAPPADDATWLRRVTIDLLGRVPTEEEARAFVADGDLRKRERAVDRLLADPGHARRLARWWEDILLGPETRERRVDRDALRRWLEQRFAQDEGWDAIVRGLVTASGRSSAGGRRRAQLATVEEERAEEERDREVVGAVNWILRWARSPPDVASTAARAFLGVQIQCAQCHDHKTEAWKQQDFHAFAASFARTRIERLERPDVFEVEDADRVNRRLFRSELSAPMALATPRALDGTTLVAEDETPRERLAAWMTSRDNPWTSRAFVNRLWARHLGVGFVDPVDDLRPSSPATLAPLLDALAERFEASGWSVRSLERSIVLSRAYGLSATKLAGDVALARWSTFAVRPMDEDALVDSFATAVDLESRLAALPAERAQLVRAGLRRAISVSFDADAESNPTRFDGTIQQALLLMNAEAVAAGVAVAPRSALGALLERHHGDALRVAESLFWRTLSRGPTDAERARFAELLLAARHEAAADAAAAAAPPPEDPLPRGPRLGGARSRADTPEERALEDLFWALLNSAELAFVR